MGYELHITRKENWFDEDLTADISLEKWIELVNNDPEMRLDHEATATTTGSEAITVYSIGLSVWTAYPLDGINGNRAWFSYERGNICVKNPDKEIIQKMLAIAALLGAKVMDDEGEVYLPDHKPATTASAKKKWWQF